MIPETAYAGLPYAIVYTSSMVRLTGKRTVFAVLIAVVIVMSVGGVLTADMMAEESMGHHCPFMGIPSLCAMSPLTHLSQWQQMFATTLQEVSVLSLLLLFAAVILSNFLLHLTLPRRARVHIPRRRNKTKVRDRLHLALARGTIHSKAF